MDAKDYPTCGICKATFGCACHEIEYAYHFGRSEGVVIGDDFSLYFREGFTPDDTGRVVSLHGDLVVWTPVYNRRFNEVFYVERIALVEQGIAVLRAMGETFRRQQEAEIRAETSYPQHMVW